MQQEIFPILEQQKAWKALNPAGALELDLVALHSRAKDYLPNVTKADLRNTLGAGPFTLDQVQEVFSKRTKQGQDFQLQYTSYLGTKAGKGTAADAAVRQLEDWQDIGKMSKEDRKAVRDYLGSLAAGPVGQPEGQ